jgi:hypothetical protein
MRLPSAQGFSHSGYVKTGGEIYRCELMEMSATGATLSFEGPVDLPDHFTIQLTSDGKVTRHCLVSWSEGIYVGVVFKNGAPPCAMSD